MQVQPTLFRNNIGFNGIYKNININNISEISNNHLSTVMNYLGNFAGIFKTKQLLLNWSSVTSTLPEQSLLH